MGDTKKVTEPLREGNKRKRIKDRSQTARIRKEWSSSRKKSEILNWRCQHPERIDQKH